MLGKLFSNTYIKHSFNNFLGLIFGEGESWKNQRRFTLRHLRGFGFGKSSMETVIHEEISELIMRLKSGPNPVRLDNAFGPPVINVLWVILSGKRLAKILTTTN